MKILTHLVSIVLAIGFTLTAGAQTTSEKPEPRLLDLKGDFPAKEAAGDSEYAECRACFDQADTIGRAREAVRKAEETRKNLVQKLKDAEEAQKDKEEKKRLVETRKWLNDPFAKYVDRWKKLIEELEKKKESPVERATVSEDKPGAAVEDGRKVNAGDALYMVKSITDSQQAWVDSHRGMKSDLNKLGEVAKRIDQAGGRADAKDADEFHAAIDAAVKRAETIANRDSETADSKEIARQVEERLRNLK
jgi:hypothetical protein